MNKFFFFIFFIIKLFPFGNEYICFDVEEFIFTSTLFMTYVIMNRFVIIVIFISLNF